MSIFLYLEVSRNSSVFMVISFLQLYFSSKAAAAAAKSLQLCLTLCDPIDNSPPGCPVPGILQARTLEWVAISFSNAWKWKVKVKSLSRVWLYATPWTTAYQAPPSVGFSRKEYWSGENHSGGGISLLLTQGKLWNKMHRCAEVSSSAKTV